MAIKRVWCQEKPLETAYLGYDPSDSEKIRKKAPNRVVCPKCKKRFKPRVRECHDYGCWHVFVPAHKKIVKQRKKTRRTGK